MMLLLLVCINLPLEIETIKICSVAPFVSVHNLQNTQAHIVFVCTLIDFCL